MKKLLKIIGLFLAMSLSAVASDINTTNSSQALPNWYIGFGVGSSMYSDEGMGKSFDNFSVEVDKSSDFGFKVYGGYQINNIVGVEASYIQYGKFDFKTADKYTKYVTAEIEPKSLNIAANLGYGFLNNELKPYALVGLGYVVFDQTGSPEVYSSENGLAFSWGIGMDYTPSLFKGVGFRISFDNTCPVVVQSFNDSSKDKVFVNPLRLLSLGVQYKF